MAACPTCAARRGVLRGRKVASGVQLLVVPGSQQVKRAAEAEGLDRVFIDAGGEWRESGCSMCIGMNGDKVGAGPGRGEHQQPQLRGPPGPGRAHAAGQPAHRRGQRRARPRHRPARAARQLGQHGTPHEIQRAHRGAAVHEHRHRPDHPGALPAHHRTRGPGQAAVPRLALRRRPARRAPTSC